MTVLVNGAYTREFNMGKGLRQGYPLSPLLFDIAAEALSRMLTKVEEIGLIYGVSLGSRPFTHLQYADDVLLFSGDSLEGLLNLKHMLRCFALLTGLKINFYKSALIGINS